MIRTVFLFIGLSVGLGFAQESYLDRNLDPYYSTVRHIEDFRWSEVPGLYEGEIGRWNGISGSGVYQFIIINSDSVAGKKELVYSEWRHNYPGHIMDLVDINGDYRLDGILAIDNEYYWVDDIRYSNNKPKSLKKMGEGGEMYCPAGIDQIFYKNEKALSVYQGIKGEVEVDPIGTSVKIGKGKSKFYSYKSPLISETRLKAIADVDSNSVMDFLLFRYSEPYLFMPQEAGKFQESDLHKLSGEWDENNSYFFMDWSESELLDLIEITDTAVFLYKAKGKALFEKKQLLYDAKNGNNSFEHIVRDIDGDGLNDLVIYSTDVVYIHNEGANPAKSFFLGEGHYDINGGSVADINGDGHLDILVNSYLGLVYFEQHHGHFHTPRIFTLFKYAEFYYQNDMDNDGDLDLLIHDDGSSLLWIENRDGVMQDVAVWRF